MTTQPQPRPPGPPSAATTAGRLRWPDVAKGASILLVVLHHVVVKDHAFLVGPSLAPVADAWQGLSYALKPVRMPLFFVVSGLFAAGAVARPWRTTARRFVAGYYLYVVWLAIFVGIYALDREVPANRVLDLADLLGELVWAASSLWFLYALAVYAVVARLLRDLPPALVVGAAALLSVSVSAFGIEENNRYSVLVHLVWFLAGARFPGLVRSIAGLRCSTPAVLGLAAGYAAAVAVVYGTVLPRSLTTFAASLVGVPLGILFAARVADSRSGEALAWVGRRTLRVYVLHLAVLVALVQLPWPPAIDGEPGLAVALGYPLVMSAVVVGGCLLVHQVLVRLGAGWLFELPRPVDQWLAGQPDPARGPKVPSDARSGGVA